MQKKSKKTLVVKKKEMDKEHINLIRILETGSKKERMKEAKKQRKELKEFED